MKFYQAIFSSVIISSSLITQAQTSSTKLEIKVTKRTFGDINPKPFIGVGVFDLLRGISKFEGASCPDKSGASGGINCSIPCQKDIETPITIRVKPPSNQDHLAGWVTPTHQDVELRGCILVPQVLTMKYDDAKFALNDLINTKFAHVDAKGGIASDQWVKLLKADTPFATKLVAGSIETVSGRSDLLNIYRYASEGSKSYLLPKTVQAVIPVDDVEASSALIKWQILSKSALLGAQVEKSIPSIQRGKIKIEVTEDVASYLASLKQADILLGEIKEKNPEQLKLADDIKTLRSMPATGKNAEAAFPIIQRWK